MGTLYITVRDKTHLDETALARKTTHKIQLMKKKGQKIVMLTAYDAPTARILSECGVDMILVGDSVGNSLLGYESTIPVTLDDVIHHCAAVKRGGPKSLIVGDMPFMSYKVSIEQALQNCGRMLQEGGAEAVKIEGAGRVLPTVEAIVDAGIPVMGHIGLTPQSIFELGGYRIQGRTAEKAEMLVEQAKQLESAGAFSLVIELVPSETAKLITEAIDIPTIGIGAGPHCDGQVLVLWDMLGLFEEFKPKFVKKYADIRSVIVKAVQEYSDEVRTGEFPDPGHSFEMSEEESGRLYGRVKPNED
ncbi:3-methyl-2-oxobutanoate hydroxymethyltransferase [Candidatus Thorarchaeota archaeon]|nr:MAG: 3-methyl-2-oxobutanoate hydroxymethyltransferase [Candidatus Thorarchaeota archaeon]